jgi:hypothetical protein
LTYRFSRRKSLIGNNAEFENDARFNREPVKRFQKWSTMGKPWRVRVTILGKQF